MASRKSKKKVIRKKLSSKKKVRRSTKKKTASRRVAARQTSARSLDHPLSETELATCKEAPDQYLMVEVRFRSPEPAMIEVLDQEAIRDALLEALPRLSVLTSFNVDHSTWPVFDTVDVTQMVVPGARQVAKASGLLPVPPEPPADLTDETSVPPTPDSQDLAAHEPTGGSDAGSVNETPVASPDPVIAETPASVPTVGDVPPELNETPEGVGSEPVAPAAPLEVVSNAPPPPPPPPEMSEVPPPPPMDSTATG